MTRKERKPHTPFKIGQRADRCGTGVLDVIDLTGRDVVRREHLTEGQIEDWLEQRMEIRVLWELSCGTKLTFQRGRGPDPDNVEADRAVCFRVVEIDLPWERGSG